MNGKVTEYLLTGRQYPPVFVDNATSPVDVLGLATTTAPRRQARADGLEALASCRLGGVVAYSRRSPPSQTLKEKVSVWGASALNNTPGRQHSMAPNPPNQLGETHALADFSSL